MSSFLQSPDWAKLQEKLGRKVRQISKEGIKAVIIEQKLPLKKKYFYIPHGPIFDNLDKTKWKTFIKETEEISGQNPIFLRVEPQPQRETNEETIGFLKDLGFRKTAPVQPDTTIIIDLNKSETELMENMEHDTRYSIRAAQKRGVNIKVVKELKEKNASFGEFWEIFENTNKRHELVRYDEKYYREVLNLAGDCQSVLYLAELQGKMIAAAIIVIFGGGAFYLFAGSLSGYGRYNAPTLLLWRAIQEAKNAGLVFFDLWGISESKKSWVGITLFKKSFGGKIVHYPGTWDFVFSKNWYRLYALAKIFHP